VNCGVLLIIVAKNHGSLSIILAYLKLTGAQEFVDQYNVDATTDFHQMAADIVGVPRKQAKDINLGLFYGMG
jgi:hypothetical protein